ncbi:hypothetical protein A6R68_19705, partial [Neotoma lepida]
MGNITVSSPMATSSKWSMCRGDQEGLHYDWCSRKGHYCSWYGKKKISGQAKEERTVQKVCTLDDNVCMAFEGHTADVRIANRAWVECQSHQSTMEDPISVEFITCYFASLKQSYTQRNGFDFDGMPKLYHNNPSNTYHIYKANAIVWDCQ